LPFPGRDFTLERPFVSDPAAQTLTLSDAQLDLGRHYCKNYL
jgi:hypothetical protein